MVDYHGLLNDIKPARSIDFTMLYGLWWLTIDLKVVRSAGLEPTSVA